MPGAISTILVHNRPGLRHFRFKGADRRRRPGSSGRVRQGFSEGSPSAPSETGSSGNAEACPSRQRHGEASFRSLQENHRCSQRIPRHHRFRTLPRAGFRIGRFGLPRQGLPAIITCEEPAAPVQETPGHRRYQVWPICLLPGRRDLSAPYWPLVGKNINGYRVHASGAIWQAPTGGRLQAAHHL